MKVKLIKKIKKNAPVEKDGDWNESKKHHAGHAGFDFAVCAYEDLQDDLDKEQKSRGLGLARNLIPRKTRGQWRVGKRVLWPVVRSFRSSNPQALHFWSVSVKRLFCRSRDCRPVHWLARQVWKLYFRGRHSGPVNLKALSQPCGRVDRAWSSRVLSFIPRGTSRRRSSLA